MKKYLFIAFISLGVTGLNGCGKTVPVSSTREVTTMSDSTRIATKTTTRDSSYIETLIKRIIPETSVDIAFTPAQFDSLVRALESMPVVTRTIYQADPAMRTTLQILMDSLGRITIKCTTLEREYYEKTISQERTIESMAVELTRSNRENTELQHEVVQARIRFGNQVRMLASGIGLLAILGGVAWLMRKFKVF